MSREAGHHAFDAENVCGLLAALPAVGMPSTDRALAQRIMDWADEHCRTLAEFRDLAVWTMEKRGDDGLAGELAVRGIEQAGSLREARECVSGLLADGWEPALLRPAYERALSLCNTVPATITFAEGYLSLFDDEQAARARLEGLRASCRGTGEITQLAAGYRHLFGDVARVRELLRDAHECAQSAVELTRLAEAYWKLLQDRECSLLVYDAALQRTEPVRDLLVLGKSVLSELGERRFAERAYRQAASQADGVPGLLAVARAVRDDLGESDHAAALLQRALSRADSPDARQTLRNLLCRHFPQASEMIARLDPAGDADRLPG
jgi:tetratricopeptide (TPR) repeat protein